MVTQPERDQVTHPLYVLGQAAKVGGVAGTYIIHLLYFHSPISFKIHISSTVTPIVPVLFHSIMRQ